MLVLSGIISIVFLLVAAANLVVLIVEIVRQERSR